MLATSYCRLSVQGMNLSLESECNNNNTKSSQFLNIKGKLIRKYIKVAIIVGSHKMVKLDGSTLSSQSLDSYLRWPILGSCAD